MFTTCYIYAKNGEFRQSIWYNTEWEIQYITLLIDNESPPVIKVSHLLHDMDLNWDDYPIITIPSSDIFFIVRIKEDF